MKETALLKKSEIKKNVLATSQVYQNSIRNY